MARHEDEVIDVVMDAFLSFLGTDIQNNPAQVKPFDMNVFAQGQELVAGLNVNIDDEIIFDKDE